MCSAGFRNLSYSLPTKPNLIYSLITILPNQRFGGFKKAHFAKLPINSRIAYEPLLPAYSLLLSIYFKVFLRIQID